MFVPCQSLIGFKNIPLELIWYVHFGVRYVKKTEHQGFGYCAPMSFTQEKEKKEEKRKGRKSADYVWVVNVELKR